MKLVKRYRNLFSLAIFGSANVLRRGMTTLLALLYATTLSSSELGIYALMIAVAEIAGVMGDAGLSQAVIRTYFDLHQDRKKAFEFLSRAMISARIIAMILLAIMGVVAFFAWDVLTAGTAPRWPFLAFALVIAFFNRIGLMIDGVFQALQEAEAYGLFSFTQSIATLALGALFVMVFDLGLVGALGALVLAMALANVVRVIHSLRYFPRGFGSLTKPEIRSLFAYGLPLLPKQLSIWGRQMALRLVLAHLVPIAAVGVFFFASSIAAVAAMATTMLEPVLTPVYLKQRVSEAKDFRIKIRAFLRTVLALLLPAYLACVLFAAPVIAPFLSDEYAGALPLIPLLFLNLFFQSQEALMTKQLVYHKRTGIISTLTTVPVVAALCILPVVVPWFGLEGAIWAMTAANMLVLALLQIAIIRIEPSDYPIASAILAAVVMVVGAAYIAATEAVTYDPLELGLRLAALALVTAGTAIFWIWPNRALLLSILKR